jgi:hypothetical protein
MHSLFEVFKGWEGCQTSLIHVVSPLSVEHLKYRPAADRRSVGEIVRHITRNGTGLSFFLRS